jgi:hypothetical protein
VGAERVGAPRPPLTRRRGGLGRERFGPECHRVGGGLLLLLGSWTLPREGSRSGARTPSAGSRQAPPEQAGPHPPQGSGLPNEGMEIRRPRRLVGPEHPRRHAEPPAGAWSTACG